MYVHFPLSWNKCLMFWKVGFLHKNKMLQNLINQNLNININSKSQIRVINVTFLCVQTIPTRCPSMMEVLECYLERNKHGGCISRILVSKQNYSISLDQAINLPMQNSHFTTKMGCHRNFQTIVMAWLNLKHVGSLVIHNMMTHLCVWAIEQLVVLVTMTSTISTWIVHTCLILKHALVWKKNLNNFLSSLIACSPP
jgi:hypothetical protein